MHWLARTELLIGEKNVERLRNSHVLVAGLGGVGAYAAEQLCRAGIGELSIVDGDTIHITNINRQLPALNSTLGMPKAEVLGQRLMDINPNLKLHVYQEYIRDERMTEILANRYDYVVDAIDTLSPKFYLIYLSLLNGYRLVSSMGSGERLTHCRCRLPIFRNRTPALWRVTCESAFTGGAFTKGLKWFSHRRKCPNMP